MSFKKPPRYYKDIDQVISPETMDSSDTSFSGDLVDKISSIDFSSLSIAHYIEIWVVLVVVISTIYYVRYKNSIKKSKDFNESIISKNNERAKVAREKLESSYENDLKTKPIPSPTDTHNYTKKFDKSTTSSSDHKSTEGMNPSTTRQRITFNSRDRSFVKFY